MHARTVGVEDANDLHIHLVLAIVIKKQRFGAALAFVIAGTRTDWIYIAPITLSLRVDMGITVDFTGRGLKNARTQTLRQTKHVDGTMHAGLSRLNWVALIMNR